MGVREDQRRLSVAALLVFLLTAFALSPPEIFYRSHNSRARANRVVGLDDHDHDQTVDVPRVSDLADAGSNDGPAAAVLPRVGIPPGPPGFTGELLAVPSNSFLFSAFFGRTLGRAPPLVVS